MPTFNPTIINNTTPPVSAVATNVTYDEIKRSLGSSVYFVNKVYLYSNIFRQISGIVNYSHYDVNGNKTLESLTPSIDPYQFEKSIFYDLTEKQRNVIMDGQNSFKFVLLANATLKFKLYTNRLTNQNALDITSVNNFKSLESAMGDFSFFEDWQKQI